MSYDYDRWSNFTKDELICQHTGLENPNETQFIFLIDTLQEIRDWYGKSMVVTSGYRDPSHPIEARKAYPGYHTIAAVDFRVPVEDAHMLMKMVFDKGATGVGVHQRGDHDKRFLHMDFRPFARLWSY